jgi:hypothetical protein
MMSTSLWHAFSEEGERCAVLVLPMAGRICQQNSVANAPLHCVGSAYALVRLILIDREYLSP